MLADSTDVQVADLMTIDPVTVALDATIEDAEELLRRYQVSGLPVVDAAGHLVGVISQTDLLYLAAPSVRALIRHRDSGIRVGEVMSSPPVTIDGTAPIRDAARLMSERRLHRLMAVDEQGAADRCSVGHGLRVVGGGGLTPMSSVLRRTRNQPLRTAQLHAPRRVRVTLLGDRAGPSDAMNDPRRSSPAFPIALPFRALFQVFRTDLSGSLWMFPPQRTLHMCRMSRIVQADRTERDKRRRRESMPRSTAA